MKESSKYTVACKTSFLSACAPSPLAMPSTAESCFSLGQQQSDKSIARCPESERSLSALDEV